MRTREAIEIENERLRREIEGLKAQLETARAGHAKQRALRDYYFAAKCINSLIERLGYTPSSIASGAYRIADALLEERGNP